MSTSVITPQLQVARRPVIPATRVPRIVSLPVLAVGPVASVLFLMNHTGFWLQPWQLAGALAIVMSLWSPLPWSIPALMLQDSRDHALADRHGPVGTVRRAFELVPYLTCDPASPVRLEMAASLVGFAVGVIAALPVWLA